MFYKPLISEAEARSQYLQLIESIKVHEMPAKAAMLRAQFDIILHLCIESHLGRELSRNDEFRVVDIINILFPEGEPALKDLRDKLHQLRKMLNTLSAHIYPQYKRLQQGKCAQVFGRYEYEFSLDVISELIAFVSGSPIPPQINEAKMRLERVRIANNNRLDILLMMELFTSIDEVQDGDILIRHYKEMLSKKNELGLTNVHFQLITYCQPICTSINRPLSSSTPFNETLKESLKQLYDALDLRAAYQCERPWFILLCRGLPREVDSGLIQALKELYSEKKIDFMPMALNEEVVSQYKSTWPHCGPIRLSPSMSSNFFKELLASIQRVLQSNQDNK